MPVLAFLSFCSRSVLVSMLSTEDGVSRPQAKAGEQKSTPGREQKGIQKSGKKPALIPYLDNIEITLMKIFAKSPEKSNKSCIFLVNRFYSLCVIELLYFEVVVKLGGYNSREMGVSLENPLERITIEYK